MRSFVTCTVLASIASAVAQLGHPLFAYPDTVPLDKRQEPGTPRYQCHEDCGVLISLGRQDGYCETAEWAERYGRCMGCALEYGIWKYYSGGVITAAGKCGLTPTPSPSGAAAATTAAPAPTTGTSTTAPPVEKSPSSSAPAAAFSSSAASDVPATTLSTQTGTVASDSATAPAGSSAGTSAAAAATRVHSTGASILIACAVWAWYLP